MRLHDVPPVLWLTCTPLGQLETFEDIRLQLISSGATSDACTTKSMFRWSGQALDGKVVLSDSFQCQILGVTLVSSELGGLPKDN